ncbi:MAG: hypothetical protein RDU14_15165 [Melioribacteraceae bacterium]|nr:hypothetical protein [Melioribacteraceae bacterium]
MTKYQNKYRIESTRLNVCDYSNPWWYFVTINTKAHIEYFGIIEKEMMILNELAKVVEKCWVDIPKHFINTELDYYMILPNHIHGIIILNDTGRDVVCNVSTE